MTEETEQEAPAENADELAALAAEAADDEPPTDETGQPIEQAAEADVSSQQAIAMLLGPTFAIMAPRWNVQPAEIEQLAQAYGDLADKYMPDGISVGVELNAALITMMILAPRIGTPRSDAAAEKAERKKAARAAKNAAAQETKAEAPAAEADFDPSAFTDDNGPQGADDAEA